MFPLLSRWYIERKNSAEKFPQYPELMQKGESFPAEQIVIDSAILLVIE